MCGKGPTSSAVNSWPAPVAAVFRVLLGHSAMIQIMTGRKFVVEITGINYILKYIKIIILLYTTIFYIYIYIHTHTHTHTPPFKSLESVIF